MSVIARYYQTAQQARNARQSLFDKGLPERFIALVETAAESEDAPVLPVTDVVAGSMKAGRLLGEHAAFYAANMQPGYTLLVVEAPFGHSGETLDILEAHGPLDITHEPPAPPKAPFVPFSRQAAPLSSLLGWQVLSRSPETYSQFWGFPELSNRLSFLGRWFPTLTRPRFALSSLFGMGLLSRNPAPLSSLLNLPMKSGVTGNAWTSSFGLPLLTESGAPVTANLGLPLLSRKRWLY
jgi:hypothetical protein